MTIPLLETQNVTKYFDFPVLRKVNIFVNPGERFGLIGPNGSGKTTLINLISGILNPSHGRIFFAGEEITKLPAHKRARLGIARTFQIPKPFVSITLLENLLIPLKYAPDDINDQPTEESLRILALVRLESKAHLRPTDLTQIELRKLELVRALCLKPKLLLLDEVMAGLSNAEVDDILSILQTLSEKGIAILMIEHIMRAVINFCERISVLNAGEKIAEGTPKEILNNKDVERAYLGE